MRLGLASDIHGNRVALEAIVADGMREGVDQWWVLGDLVAIGPEPVRTLDLLANLPRMTAISGNTERTVLPDGTAVLGVHASPGRDDGAGITPHRDEDDLRHELEGAHADLVVGGHTHQPTDRRVGNIRAVNLGSVSNPITDDLRASYVIIHADSHGHSIGHRRVSYDHQAFLTTVAASDHPAADYIASFQRGEQVLYPANRPGAPTPGSRPR